MTPARPLPRAVALCVALVLAGCDDTSSPPMPPTLDVVQASTPPVGAGPQSDSIAVPVGLVVQIDVTPDGYGTAPTVAVRSDDSAVLSVVAMGSGEYLLVGEAQGATNLHFFANAQETTTLTLNGSNVTSVPVHVPPQPPQ